MILKVSPSSTSVPSGSSIYSITYKSSEGSYFELLCHFLNVFICTILQIYLCHVMHIHVVLVPNAMLVTNGSATLGRRLLFAVNPLSKYPSDEGICPMF